MNQNSYFFYFFGARVLCYGCLSVVFPDETEEWDDHSGPTAEVRAGGGTSEEPPGSPSFSQDLMGGGTPEGTMSGSSLYTEALFRQKLIL